MERSFSVVCEYLPDDPAMELLLSRLNRYAGEPGGKMEGVVFYASAVDLSGLARRFPFLRFLRLRRGREFHHSLFINSAFKYIRGSIAVFVGPGVIPSKGDLYALASAARDGVSLSWMEPARMFLPKSRWGRIMKRWKARVSLLRRRLLESLSPPFYFGPVRFFALNRTTFESIFGRGGFFGRRFLLRSEIPLKNGLYLNPYVTHVLAKKKGEVCRLPPGNSRMRDVAAPGWMSSYRHLWALLTLSRRMKNRNFALRAERFLWPVVHLSCLLFWIFLWLSPLHSLLFLGFYALIGFIFYRRAIGAGMKHPRKSLPQRALGAVFLWVVFFVLAISV